jgi:glycosyltransferase involved in cell wall biosynthesis
MSEALPTLSIVTISLNQRRFLEECLRSVLSQKAPGVEYIVVDPGSADGSRELLGRHARDLDAIVLEPDRGPADGLNKGFARAAGELFGYLNADDRFAPGALDFVRRYFAANPSIDVLCGSIRMIDQDGRASLRARTADRFDVRRYLAGVCTIGQQATFFRRAAYLRAGGFNIGNRVAWDGELLVDMALAGARFATVGRVLGEFRIYGAQITGSATYRERLEGYRRRLEKKLVDRGIRTYSSGVESLLRATYKLNVLRHAGYLIARWF